MDLLYIALPAALALGAIFLLAFLWASKRGQYDDLDTPSIRMLHDEPISGSDINRNERYDPGISASGTDEGGLDPPVRAEGG